MAGDNATPDTLLREYANGACDECGRPGEPVVVESGALLLAVCRICHTQWPHPHLELAEIDTTGNFFPVLPEVRTYRTVSGAKPEWVKAALKAQGERDRADSLELARIVIVKRPDQT
jgi:hypothetical protein